MEDYDKKVEENIERNKIFIEEFKVWLNDKGLVKKTIEKHLSNIDLYLNDFLNYYEVETMEVGINRIDSFLGDWFVRKCMWSSKNSIKENSASIKKFYKCMSEKGYVKEEDYNSLCEEIKDYMEDWLDNVDDYDSDDFFNFF